MADTASKTKALIEKSRNEKASPENPVEPNANAVVLGDAPLVGDSVSPDLDNILSGLGLPDPVAVVKEAAENLPIVPGSPDTQDTQPTQVVAASPQIAVPVTVIGDTPELAPELQAELDVKADEEKRRVAREEAEATAKEQAKARPKVKAADGTETRASRRTQLEIEAGRKALGVK